ncbi:MAG TPA: DNA polymerase III subunit delta [Caulobacterales bacterium]|nr:DNA polymerase III subunit delta [Caulobacterales bacterium]
MKVSGAAVRRFLDKPDKGLRAALLFGPNTSLVHEAAQKLAAWALKGSDDPYATTKLGEDEIKRDGARLADALVAQSLLGGPTLVWARVDGKGADAAILDALEALERDEPGGFLIVEGGDLGGTSELVKAFNAAKNAAGVVFYEESDAERAAFARELSAELGLKLDRDAEDIFASALPADRGQARSEIEKLAIYADGLGRAVTGAEVSQLLADEEEGALDAASLDAVSGRAAQAVEALSRIDGLSGVSAVRALERRMLQLSDARTMMDGGMSATDAIAKLRPPVFWKERDAFASRARAWSGKKLSAAFDLLWAAELRCKQAGAPQALIAADVYRGVANLVRGGA